MHALDQTIHHYELENDLLCPLTLREQVTYAIHFPPELQLLKNIIRKEVTEEEYERK